MNLQANQQFAIEWWPIDRPRDYPRNARKWSAQAVQTVANSITQYGWKQPLVCDSSDVIIIGHLRRAAGRQAGMTQCPVLVAHDLSPEQVRGLRLMDNRSHEGAKWDFELLGPELIDLQRLGFGLDLTGFDEDELVKAMGPAPGLTDPDDCPEPPVLPVTILGDVWLLGGPSRHRVLCGDATNKGAVQVVLAGSLAAMTFCDPPYSVSYVGKTARRLTIKNDDLGADFFDFLRTACENMLAVTEGGVYICMSSSELHTLFRAFTDAGGHWSTFVIWVKNHFTLGRSDYQRQYEPILYGWRQGTDHFWCGDRNQGDVWLIDRPAASRLHPTTKPTELVTRALINSSKAGDVVADFFGGSGSTLIACESTSRICRMVEIDPKYVDVIVTRWMQFSGQQAIHEETGSTFDQMKVQRLQNQ
jgi:DNA modification methylase